MVYPYAFRGFKKLSFNSVDLGRAPNAMLLGFPGQSVVQPALKIPELVHFYSFIKVICSQGNRERGAIQSPLVAGTSPSFYLTSISPDFIWQYPLVLTSIENHESSILHTPCLYASPGQKNLLNVCKSGSCKIQTDTRKVKIQQILITTEQTGLCLPTHESDFNKKIKSEKTVP